MPLTSVEISPGAIAYFDVSVLHTDKQIIVSGDPVQRDANGNQFVCYKVNAENSYWAPLTGTYSRPRLPIDPVWVANGYGALAAGKVWLQDGKNTYQGPSSSFIAATANEQIFNAGQRPTLSNIAIQEIHKAIRARGGALGE